MNTQIDRNAGLLKGWLLSITYENALIRSQWSPR